MTDIQRIYNQVLEHYYDCDVDNANINEVWSNTLAIKGRVYSMEQLIDALSPGSVVRADIYDFNRYVDPTAIDLLGPITSRLVEIGESAFGNPLRDVNIAGKRFSSKYLSNVAQASDIIALLDSRGVHSPKIMEIGGGVGLLLQTLRKYYGGRATLFAVDLPETLFIQDWLLRNWFPDSEFAYKGTSAPVSFVIGGINLINAYVLDSQDVPIDCVININSFQEMDEDTCAAYLDYAAKNLSDEGIIYLENHFGRGDSSVTEPTEYRLDEHLTTLAVDMRFQIDTLNAYESLRLVLGKASISEDAESRRFVHRLLWNGFNAGLIPRNLELIEELARLPRSAPSNAIVESVNAVLEKYQARLSRTNLESLKASPHFDSGVFAGTFGQNIRRMCRPTQTIQEFMTEIWGSQSRVNALMSEVNSNLENPGFDLVTDRLKEIRENLVQSVADTADSEVKTANLACFLLPLGGNELGREVLVNCAENSRQSYWLVRFSQLLAYYAYRDEAAWILGTLDDLWDLNPMVVAHVATIMHTVGRQKDADSIMERLLGISDGLNPVAIATIARACAKIKYPELADEVLAKMVSLAKDGQMHDVLEFLQFALLCSPEESGKYLVSQFFDQVTVDMERPELRLVAGALRHQVGDESLAAPMIEESLHGLPRDYYSLGWAGNVLMRAGLDDSADVCLRNSVALRPSNFTHSEYVGNIYYSAGKWRAASRIYDAALAVVPYARSVRARKLFCDLPESYKRAGTFSDPFGLTMVFQENQDFYSDVLPSVKPRPRLTNPILVTRPPASEGIPG